MTTNHQITLALTTVGSRLDAEMIARRILADRLAACAHIEGPLTSYYFWKDELEQDEEYRILFKTVPSSAEALRVAVLKSHSYETPFWASWTATTSADYKAWLTRSMA